MQQILSLLYNPSLELILLITAILINVFLAAIVYFADTKSATNRFFALLTLFTLVWMVVTYVVRIPNLLLDSLLLHRLGIFFAAGMSVLFLLLAHTIPHQTLQMTRRIFLVLLALTVFMMLCNLSPYAFTDIEVIREVSQPVPGPGLAPFSILSTIFSALAVYFLVRRYRRSGGAERKQIGFMLLGIVVMLSLVIATILVPILLFQSVAFLPFTPIYVLVFLGLTAYAITKYELFNIKVLLTQAITIVIWIVVFAKIFGDQTTSARIIDALLLIFITIAGYFLVRSVKREVEQRLLIEAQEKELEQVNRQQESLLHFISHEVKGYLTKSEAAFAAIFAGDFGEVTPKLHEMSGEALEDVRRGVDTVIDILDASNLRRGTVSYARDAFDFASAVGEIVRELEPSAKARGLDLHFDKPITGAYMIVGDEDKIRRHVIRNIIDNSIKYTLRGSVRVELSRNDSVLRMVVSDTGVGITQDDMKHLFTEGGKGAESIKINVHSTGYGLFIAKTITEGHGGKIWAESDGKDMGSRFIIELPVCFKE